MIRVASLVSGVYNIDAPESIKRPAGIDLDRGPGIPEELNGDAIGVIDREDKGRTLLSDK